MLSRVKAAGIVGCGGAGFPTYAKLDCEAEYFILNGAECEPLLATDKYIMRHFSREILSAALRCQAQVGAKELVIAVKDHYGAEIAAMEAAIVELGASARVFPLKNYYPAGDEQMIVYEVTGRIVPAGGIPRDVGVVVDNIATMLCVHDALDEKPFTHKYLTVGGDVPTPCLVRAPIGTPLSLCLTAAGTELREDAFYVLGGPMMGKMLTAAEMGEQVVTKTTSGLLVLTDPHTRSRGALTPERMLSRAKSVCIQCRYCTDLCPRALLGHPLEPHKIMRKMAFAKSVEEVLDDPDIRNAALCSECSVCENYACPMGINPRRINSMIKAALAENAIKYQTEERAFTAHTMRDYRMVPTQNLIARLGLLNWADTHLDICHALEPERICVPLKQHIGAPAIPVVAQGDRVQAGQMIAEAAQESLSVPMHSGMAGIVADITKDAIVIQQKRG